MPRLKNRQQQIPNGFRYREPVTGWRSRPFTSFDMIVQQLIELRLANPHHAKTHNWSTDYDTVANEVDAFNTLICQKMGWRDYITDGEPSGDLGGSAPIPFREPRIPIGSPNPGPREGAVVAGAKNVAAGIALVADWLGEELIPVEKALAENRASVCVTCPMNQDPNFLAKLTGIAAEEIRSLIGVRNQMELRTSLDGNLHTCAACECYLPLKVWAPLDHIKAHMREEVKAKLDPICWILHEQNT